MEMFNIKNYIQTIVIFILLAIIYIKTLLVNLIFKIILFPWFKKNKIMNKYIIENFFRNIKEDYELIQSDDNIMGQMRNIVSNILNEQLIINTSDCIAKDWFCGYSYNLDTMMIFNFFNTIVILNNKNVYKCGQTIFEFNVNEKLLFQLI